MGNGGRTGRWADVGASPPPGTGPQSFWYCWTSRFSADFTSSAVVCAMAITSTTSPRSPMLITLVYPLLSLVGLANDLPPGTPDTEVMLSDEYPGEVPPMSASKKSLAFAVESNR